MVMTLCRRGGHSSPSPAVMSFGFVTQNSLRRTQNILRQPDAMYLFIYLFNMVSQPEWTCCVNRIENNSRVCIHNNVLMIFSDAERNIFSVCVCVFSLLCTSEVLNMEMWCKKTVRAQSEPRAWIPIRLYVCKTALHPSGKGSLVIKCLSIYISVSLYVCVLPLNGPEKGIVKHFLLFFFFHQSTLPLHTFSEEW